MLHRKCVTESGDEAGAVKDIVIDIEQKKIKAIKLSEGFWERLTGRGIRYLPAAAVIKWSPDPIVIKEEANDQWVDNLQQLK
nr:PRC-barrel domain-containing protein [Scopulibacillus daqui]